MAAAFKMARRWISLKKMGMPMTQSATLVCRFFSAMLLRLDRIMPST